MIGISTSTFYSKLSTEDSVNKIAQMGSRTLEVFLNTFSEYTTDYLDIIGERVEETGLRFNSVHTLPTQFEPQLFALSSRQKEDALYFFENVLKGASKYGCKMYVLHGTPYYRKNTGIISLDASKVVEPLNMLCDIAKKYDMKIALENVHWAMCNNLDFVNFIKNDVTDIGFTLDIKQAHLSRLTYKDYLDAFGDRLLNVHICDYMGNSPCMIGKGQVDFNRLAQDLKNANYKGDVMLELYPNDYDTFDEVKDAFDYCNRVFEI